MISKIADQIKKIVLKMKIFSSIDLLGGSIFYKNSGFEAAITEE